MLPRFSPVTPATLTVAEGLVILVIRTTTRWPATALKNNLASCPDLAVAVLTVGPSIRIDPVTSDTSDRFNVMLPDPLEASTPIVYVPEEGSNTLLLRPA